MRGCKPLVSAMLNLALQSKDVPATPKETVCGCMTHSHDELRAAVRGAGFATAREAMLALGWSKADGCEICRPALEYYVGQALSAAGAAAGKAGAAPAAGLLADGTYAVVPRMYGGVTSAEQLRRIADVIDKYDIPLVKLTGGAHLECWASTQGLLAPSARSSDSRSPQFRLTVRRLRLWLRAQASATTAVLCRILSGWAPVSNAG
ncbi:(2Fe-2S)-binding protein [Paenibacillus sp. P26]|nr:(2Fe-2S)-binding protein [Paenibacillus sp. P26]